jgi:hypothetical protein
MPMIRIATLAMLCCFAALCRAQIQIIPANPTTSDYVVITADFNGCIEDVELVQTATIFTGRIVYSSSCFYGIPPGGTIPFSVGWLAPGNYNVTVYNVNPPSPLMPAAQTAAFSVVAVPPPPSNYQGLWWSSDESGWGINLVHQGDTIFATWFTYAANGNSIWFAMTAHKSAPNSYSGDLYESHGPAFNAVPFLPENVVSTKVGMATLSFPDAENGTFAYSIDGTSQTKNITRQVFGNLPRCVFGALSDLSYSTNYTDIWWNAPRVADESGWGINLTHQGDTIFATWFTYDFDGTPTWLVATLLKEPGDSTGYDGTIYRTTGPPYFASPFDPSKVLATELGNMQIAIVDGKSVVLQYAMNALAGSVFQRKWIDRETIVAPGTLCN